MKKWLSKFLVVSLSVSMLVGCAGLSVNSDAAYTPPTAKPTYLKSKSSTKSYQRNTQSKHSNTAAISLNDFNDLNLNLNNRDVSQGNLWDKIRDGLQIPDASDRPEVQAQIRWFMAHPGYLQRTTERARPYLYIVYQEVKSRGLPTELVLLPINESGYYPFSYSVTGATGIWQLMPGTASNFGLKHDFWYDGRRDIFDSTNAALDYLTYLANYFNNDWLLAIGAYDTGEGNIQNAINRNQRAGLPTDFWSLRVSAETRSYVPRLLALAAIIRNPDRYPMIHLPPVDDKPVVGSVSVNKQINLTQAANMAGISLNQLKVLNPGLSRSTTDPNGNSKLLLPIDSVDTFKQKLSSLAPEPTPTTSIQYGHYRVQRGDSLQSIANRFNITEQQLREANGILGHRVAIGRVLLIPNVTENYQPNTSINLDQASLSLSQQDDSGANSDEVANSPAATSTHHTISPKAKTINTRSNDNDNDQVTTSPVSKRHGIRHEIKRGDTLSSISRQYHVSLAQLERLNPGISHHPLKAGEVINVTETNQPIASNDASSKQSTNSHDAKPKQKIVTHTKKIHSKEVKNTSSHQKVKAHKKTQTKAAPKKESRKK